MWKEIAKLLQPQTWWKAIDAGERNGRSYAHFQTGNNNRSGFHGKESWVKGYCAGDDGRFLVEYEVVPKKVYKVDENGNKIELDEFTKALYL